MNTKLLNSQWQRLPEKTIRALQLVKLRRYLRDIVLPSSAYYREMFRGLNITADDIRSFDDWAHVPFTQKADLLPSADNPQKAKDFLLLPDRNRLARRPSTILRAIFYGREKAKRHLEDEYRPIFLTSTTGRSADPVSFLYSQHDLCNLKMGAERVFQIAGATREDKMLNMFPYAPHLAFWLSHYGSTTFGSFMASTGGGKTMGTEGQLRFLKKVNPEVLIGMPTFVYHVLHEAVEQGVRCTNLRRIVLGGEKVPDGMRTKLRNLALELDSHGCDVVSTYGFTEAKMAFAECPAPAGEAMAGFHTFPDLALFEIVDPISGTPVGPGEPGEIVYTPLDARGTVALRYRTGDCISEGLHYEECPHCGRMLPRLVGKISRSSAVQEMSLGKLKGTLVDFNELEHLLDDAHNIGAWQLELRKQNDDPMEVDELVLHLHKLGATDDLQIEKEVCRRFAAHTEVQPNRIVFHSAADMRRLQGVGTEMKEKKVVDHRPQAKPVPEELKPSKNESDTEWRVRNRAITVEDKSETILTRRDA